MTVRAGRAPGAAGVLVRCLVALVRAYRVAMVPFFGPACRFVPSCSRYAEQALLGHGLWRGGGLALWRICRCHPLSAGGLDPVPAPHAHPPAGFVAARTARG